MYLGRVVGCVWSTVKDPSLLCQRLLMIQPMTPELRDNGKPIVCLDATGAGAGETVYWVRGKEASFPFLPAEVVADTTVVGIVDTIHTTGAERSAAVPRGGLRPASPKTARPGARKGRGC
jgi:microcompartment protein CcmK/EutM